MTDVAQPTGAKTSFTRTAAYEARVKRRYASERRFRTVGFGAVAVTGIFLLLLLTNIFVKAIPAFFAHSADLAVKLDPAVITPGGKNDVATLRSADYASLVRTAFGTVIPGVEGRAAKKELSGIISSGAADDLRKRVVADPSLIGKTITVPLLLSDDADLYLKNAKPIAAATAGTGTITPSAQSGEITLSTTDGAFKNLLAEAQQLGAEKNADTGAYTLTNAMPSKLIELNGGLVKIESVTDASASGRAIMALTSAAPATAFKTVTYDTPQSRRNESDYEVSYLEKLRTAGVVDKHINWRFFTSGDSREAELAGILGSLVGTALTLLVTLALCLPVGVLAAVYLEEFAPKNRLTDIIEVNINNLAAVPSIVFGLLGLAVFLNFFGLPRSAPLVGGLVLALLVLPTIIIASRAAIKAVPPSIREAAIGLGASHQQAVFHHVLPLAMPGIMTGTIIGMAHALGETAPLLMIGMIAFIVDIPKSFSDAATVLPVQIFLWADLPEPAFQQRTAAAIVVLLAFLFLMNGAAIWLRSKFERRW